MYIKFDNAQNNEKVKKPIFNRLKNKHFITGFVIFSVLISVILNSCKKNTEKLPYQSLNSPVNSPVWKITISPKGGIFICGGEKNKNGFIYSSSDNTNTWQKRLGLVNICLYDMAFINDSLAYACGDSLSLYQSNDGGNTWYKISYSFTIEGFNYTPLRCIIGNEKFLVIAGGNNFDNGNVIWFNNGEIRWVWHFDNEFRCGIPFSNDNYWLCGYGNSYKTADEGYHYRATDFNGDFFTGACLSSDNNAWLCGYNGGIYKSADEGKSWKTLLKPNNILSKRIQFNAIDVNENGRGIAGGNKGLIYASTNGNSWQKKETDMSFDVLSVKKIGKNNEFILGCRNGKLLLVKID